MDCEPKGTNDAAVAAGSSLPDRVLPLEELMLAVPECTDPELTECARDTVNLCVVEATVRLGLKAADESVRGERRVISDEDMTRAIEGLTEEDTALGTALLEMTQRMMAGRVLLQMAQHVRAAPRRRQKRTARKEDAVVAAAPERASGAAGEPKQ